jgi:hypothetical protein
MAGGPEMIGKTLTGILIGILGLVIVSAAGAGALFGAAQACFTQTPADSLATPDPLVRSAESAQLSPEQLRNAVTITNVAASRGLPRRAAIIAVATARQESDLRNIGYGHLDSLGLFQQRPSQGWGTPEQIMDPSYAAGAFYDRLVPIDGWREMSLTQACGAR